jgi:hypothetical protein
LLGSGTPWGQWDLGVFVSFHHSLVSQKPIER